MEAHMISTLTNNHYFNFSAYNINYIAYPYRHLGFFNDLIRDINGNIIRHKNDMIKLVVQIGERNIQTPFMKFEDLNSTYLIVCIL